MFLYGPHDIGEYDLLPFLQANWIGSCCTVAASTLVFYYHASTLAQEVEFMWGRKWSSVTALFHVNRWAVFVWAVQEITSLIPLKTLSSCIGLQLANDAVGLVLAIIWAVFSAVRMLAISDRNVLLSAAVLLLNLIAVGSNAYTDFASSWEQIKNLPLLGVVCDSGSNLSPTALTNLTLGTRLCAIAADILALIVTWHRTWHVKRDADRNHVRTPLATLLLRDGTIYFIILLGSNVLNIVANGSNVFVFSVTFFSTPISSIIIADFLLNLRQVASSSQLGGLDETIQTEDQFHTFSGSLRFQGFVDNMGEEVVHSYDTSDPDMAWADNVTDDDLITSTHADQRTVGSKLRDSIISLGSDKEFVRIVVGGTTSFTTV